jgi:hypothetical protein
MRGFSIIIDVIGHHSEPKNIDLPLREDLSISFFDPEIAT